MNLFWALVLGVVSFFVAHLVFNVTVSTLVAVVIALAVAFGYDRLPLRR